MPSSHRLCRLLCALACVLVVVAGAAHAEPSRARITGGKGVGSFQLGKPFGPYEKALGAPTKVQASEVSNDAKLVYYKKYGMYFFVKKDVVNGITVSSPLFSTAEGLHVGSDEGEVTRAYGSAQKLNDGVVYPERGIGFTFEAGKVSRIYVTDKEGRDLASGDLRIVPGARVGGLRLGQSVDFVVKQWNEPSKRAPFQQKPDCELWSYEKKGIIVITWQGKIDGVMVFSPAFRTDRGIHVGSRRDAVVKAYGKAGAREEGLEAYPSLGIGFFYEEGAVKQIYVKAAGR